MVRKMQRPPGAVCLWTLPPGGHQTHLAVGYSVSPVPLGRSAGGTAPAACVETPDCGAAVEERRRANRSRSIGCPTGCPPRYCPSCLSCRPGGIESPEEILYRTLPVTERKSTVSSIFCLDTS